MGRKVALLTGLLLVWTIAAVPAAAPSPSPASPPPVSSPLKGEENKGTVWGEGSGGQGHTWVVGEGGLKTIGQALARAHHGDTVLVTLGIYREHLVLNKAVRLIGQGRPVVDGGGRGDVITIRANGVTLQGFVIRGSGRRLWENEAAVKVLGGGNRIAGNEIVESLFGIYLGGASGNTIRGNVIRGLKAGEHDRGNGIHLFGSHRNRIEENTVLYPRDGLYLEFSDGNHIAGNKILYGRIGLHYMYSNDNTFEGNVFQYNGVAAAPMYAKGIVARRNLFAHSRGYGAYGLFLKDCNDSILEENTILANEIGIFMDNSKGNRFHRNLVVANTVGARILSSSMDNLFFQNAFVDNGDQVYLNRGRLQNLWDNGQTGNYWSDYRGYDLDGDGVGDVPYKVGSLFGYLIENYPEVRILFNSPAVQVLAFAEEALPVLELPREVDRFPRMRQEALPALFPDGPVPPSHDVAVTESIAVAVVFGTSIILWRAQRRRVGCGHGRRLDEAL